MSQPFRTAEGGSVNRDKPLSFTYDGKSYTGYDGDTLASALLANGVRLVGRSLKYHRPRGIFGLGAEEPNGLVRLGKGDRAEPNLRATQVELFDGLQAESQNRWPSLSFDVGAVNGLISRFLPAGFYYKTFMWPASFWVFYERVIRQAAGLGKPPTEPDPDRYEKQHVHTEVLIAGGGPAGLAAALTAGRSGARVILADENSRLGGSLLSHPAAIDGAAADRWLEASLAELAGMDNVTLLPRASVFGYYEDNFLTIAERITDHLAEPPSNLPRQRLWKVRAKQVVLATGAIERPLVFADNDRPGVMLASAVSGYLHRYGVRSGTRLVLFANNDPAYDTALEAKAAGMAVEAIIDTRTTPGAAVLAAAESAGIRVIAGSAICETLGTMGTKCVSGVKVRSLEARSNGFSGGTERLDCDLLAVSGGWNPAVHLFSQAKGKLRYDETLAALVPDRSTAANRSAGACTGTFDLGGALAEGLAAGAAAANDAGFRAGNVPMVPATDQRQTAPQETIWAIPARKGAKRFVDFQNDVTVSNIELAAREGYLSVEHLKRYTALGMGTDQGKTSNVHGLAILAATTGRTIPAVGTTTFRPPYTPVTLGQIAGRDREEFAHPVRRSSAHQWHLDQGASMIDAGLWHRPQAYPRPGEDLMDAINREALAVRNNVGLVDVSTLGKIDIQGPDSAELLNRIYTNAWKKLPVGRGRYGLMLREDGMVYDDGVTMRMADNHFHMTTTTANAARVLQTMDFLLQTQWRDLKVFVNSATEQWFAAAISGPNARKLLSDLTDDIDLTNKAFPMMAIREGRVAGIPARVLRISFSGELSYEINVAADQGLALWRAIVQAGEPHDLTVYGTEAMNVLRIEKGHVTGAELDGRTTPDDLGLGGMVNRNKECIGKPLLDRPDLKDPERLQLVGVIAQGSGVRMPYGAQIVPEKRSGPQVYVGHVTSMAYSPTLEAHIGLALVRGGRHRHGELLYATSPTAGQTVQIEIVPPVFIDPAGERLNA